VHARARACTLHVLIEHVDFYDCTLTDCSHVRARSCLYAQIERVKARERCCVIFAATSRSITQYQQFSIVLRATATTCVHGRPRTRTYDHARGRGRTRACVVLHASTCVHVRSMGEALRMLLVICEAFSVLSCSHCFHFSLLLLVLSFVKNFVHPVTVNAHEYVYISILLGSTFT